MIALSFGSRVRVEEMNRAWSVPLVEARRGEKDQGARVSDLGAEVLAAYRGLEEQLLTGLKARPEAVLLERRLREPPL